MTNPPRGPIHAAYQRLLPEPTRVRFKIWRHRAKGRIRRANHTMFDPILRDTEERLASLAGQYAGERCFIMGNGPSLNQMDLDRFDGEHVWASNRAFLLFDRITWRPDFWVAVDRRVVPDNAAELVALQDELPDTKFFYPDHFRTSRVLRSRPNTYWFREGPFDESDIPWGVFSRDVTRHVSPVRTVTITAIQLAIHLGFDPIYLIGCDTTYSVPETVRVEDGNAEFLLSTHDDDHNHFDSRYFGAGKRWHEPHPDRMLRHYAHVAVAARELGVTIVNATVGGALEAFTRQDYRELV